MNTVQSNIATIFGNALKNTKKNVMKYNKIDGGRNSSSL